MKLISLLVILSVLFFLFSRRKRKNLEKQGIAGGYAVENEDLEMNEAISKARATFSDFDEAFDSRAFDMDSFAIKMKFAAVNDGHTHLWTKTLYKKNGIYHGTFSELKTKKGSETIAIDPTAISDWMYDKNGELGGGFTLQLIRRRMTGEERKAFDKRFSFSFPEEAM